MADQMDAVDHPMPDATAEEQPLPEEGAAKGGHADDEGKQPTAEQDAKPVAEQPAKEEDRDRGRRSSKDRGDKDRGDRDRDRGRDDRKSSRRSRSRDRKSSRRSRSRDRKRRSRSDSRSRRSRRSRSRDKKSSSRRSRSRDRRRSRSRDRRRSRSRDRKSSRRSRSHSSGSDGIGGYKPRKRNPEAPVITNGPGTGADPFASMRQQVVPTDPAAQLRMWQQQQLEARAMVLDQQAKSAATATSKTQREVYVGGLIPGAITGEALRTLFNSALTVQFTGYLMPGMDPVINVNLHPEGKYAFVEFRAPEMATAALALSGQVQLLGCNLSVARPSGYVDPSKAMQASQAANAALAAFKRQDMQALAAAALAGANLKGLGLPPHIEDPAAAAMPQVPAGMAIDGLSPLPTPCLCFVGMVTAERLKDDQEYNDMKEDLKDQFNELSTDCCQEIKVPRPYDPSLSDQYIGIANYGKIFAKLVTSDAAQVCRDKINGRLYGGQLVQVFFITEEAYNAVPKDP